MGFDFRFSFHWFFLLTAYRSSISGSADDRVWAGHPLTAAETLVSSGGKFALGFFTPNSVSYYLGIWYNHDPNKTILWVANREAPITRNDAILAIARDCKLIIATHNGSRIVWASNSSLSPASRKSLAVLTDAGNLILQDARNSHMVLWESFSELTDTFLPETKIRISLRQQGELRVLTSWRSPIDPSPGNYSMGADADAGRPPQVVLWEGTNRRWRSGHWDGLIFTGVPEMKSNLWFGFKITQQEGVLTFFYSPSGTFELVKFQLNWDGLYVQEEWVDKTRAWKAEYRHPAEECEKYNYCGNFGKCRQLDSEKCSCLGGFEFKDGYGCLRKTKLQCGNDLGEPDGFLQVGNVKLPDFVDYVGPEDASTCQSICRNNCSCTAYAFVDGINCMVWTRDLVDVQQFEVGGNTLFVRVAHSELGDQSRGKKMTIIATSVISVILICASIFLLWKCRRTRHETLNTNELPKISPSGEFSGEFEGQQTNGNELTTFKFNSLVTATDNFSDENKLGEGGFGHVYKGKLSGGQEIAVKRLSRKSSQGLEEFKNEIMLIANLQHRNLVQLLGCCIHEEEKLLLYEYMPNNSLDSYIFDDEKKSQLDWSKRFSIIEGIARGLLYLHRDSRLRIIHRDLKASNILLDEEMNPKISDFGMARIFGGSQDQANTNRVVGTYGYMAPEYAMEGLFSLKSDVYSFGVLLLEIITGIRNNGFRLSEYSNIIGYAWDLWDGNRAIELLDPSISESGRFLEEQVLRCVHVGMLCVQDVTGHRPDMATVVLMLESENATTLPRPSEPGFGSIRHEHLETVGAWSGVQDGSSNNNVTMTQIHGR